MDLIEYNKFSDIQLRNFTQRSKVVQSVPYLSSCSKVSINCGKTWTSEYNKFCYTQLRNFTQRRILHVAVKMFNQYHICHLVQIWQHWAGVFVFRVILTFRNMFAIYIRISLLQMLLNLHWTYDIYLCLYRQFVDKLRPWLYGPDKWVISWPLPTLKLLCQYIGVIGG
jgi:hypothetical protein